LFELNTGVFAVTRAPRRAGPADWAISAVIVPVVVGRQRDQHRVVAGLAGAAQHGDRQYRLDHRPTSQNSHSNETCTGRSQRELACG
jgi:hypothetical protein